MRFLGVTETCDLAALYLRLAEEGHEVKVSIDWPEARGTLANMVERTADWRAELDWLRAAPDAGIVLFEAVSEGFGAVQDSLRRDGHLVVGGSAYGDRLENDRAFSQALLAELGLPIAGTHEFDDVEEAEAFLAANPGRYVLKFCGHGFDSFDNYVGRLADGGDVRAILKARIAARSGGDARFVLMDHVQGIETGVGAFFDGSRFLRPACLDWEHKHFFAGDMGELTGEMGTVATFERSGRLFERTLGRIEPLLREAGHVGWVNLNMIVNDQGLWPLEFTCRFGYPGFAVLEPLQDIAWAELLHGLAAGTLHSVPTRPGFSVGIVLTVPPFPYTRRQLPEPVGLPVLLPEPMDEEDRRHIHLAEVGMDDGQLVTSGNYGWTMVVTGTGLTIAEAQTAAYAHAARIAVPNLRYRLDIGDRLIAGDYAKLETLGLLGG